MELFRFTTNRVDEQIRENKPPEVREAFERIKHAGFSAEEAREMIANILLEEMIATLGENALFNMERYAMKLATVPESALGDEESDIPDDE